MRTIKTRAHYSGFSMMEILVSLFIISVGLIGMASMQLSSLRGNVGSYQRTQATFFAQDLIERIRLNAPRDNPSGYVVVDETVDHRNLYWAYASGDEDCSEIPDPFCADSVLGDAASCDPFELAEFDMFITYCGFPYGDGTKTRGGISDLMNTGALTIDCNDDLTDEICDLDSSHTVNIAWTERDADSSAGFKAHDVSISF